jgi:hypothetical protein
MHFAVAVALILVVEAYLLYITPRVALVPWVAGLLAVQTAVAATRGRRIAEELTRLPSHEQVAAAVADAMCATGLSPRGAQAVSVTTDQRGVTRCTMPGVDAEVSAAFRTAVAQALAPCTTDGFAVRRSVFTGPVTPTTGLRVALGRLHPDGEAWHPVPASLSCTVEHAQAFAHAWHHWVGGDGVLRRLSGEPQRWPRREEPASTMTTASA